MANASIRPTDATAGPQTRGGDRWLAAGGVIGALLASTCCVIPLVLVTLGVSGAWIGNLTALAPYKPIFAAVALLCVGLGFWYVYFKSKTECGNGSSCAVAPSRAITKSLLWLAAALTLVALTTDWWGPLFY